MPIVNTRPIAPPPRTEQAPAAAPQGPQAPALRHACGAGCGHDQFQQRDATGAKGDGAQGTAEQRSQQQGIEALLRQVGRSGEVVKGGTIDVEWHVINKGKGIEDGNIPLRSIKKQIAVLNETYKDTGWSFNLVDVDRTTNKRWYTAAMDSGAERQMKRTLREGSAETLNVYSTNPGEGLLGWATFPNEYQRRPKLDGVVILASSLPGGASAPYNEGKTLTHEVGHWMGLYHTFQQPGDRVGDTPPQEEPNYGTPKELGGNGNYMDYVDDVAMNHFTRGQDRRMDRMWTAFREAK